jgi:hypothetical protein
MRGKPIIIQRANGRGDLDKEFGLDSQFRLRWVRVTFDGTNSSANMMTVGLKSGYDSAHDMHFWTWRSAALKIGRSYKVPDGEVDAWTFAPEDTLRMEWINPATITYGIEVGLEAVGPDDNPIQIERVSGKGDIDKEFGADSPYRLRFIRWAHTTATSDTDDLTIKLVADAGSVYNNTIWTEPEAANSDAHVRFLDEEVDNWTYGARDLLRVEFTNASSFLYGLELGLEPAVLNA